MEKFTLRLPRTEAKVPILISCPHAGTEFPEELGSHFQDKFVKNPEDTDWFVPDLYDFARDIGVTIIASRCSRYVIDVNRSPNSENLYHDGRPPSLLTPLKSFAGEDLYVQGKEPDSDEIERRKKAYYDPYHREIENILTAFKATYGKALLFEAHSIKRLVTSIRPTSFPDLMLGTYDGKSVSSPLKNAAEKALRGCPEFSLVIDDPFKGGYLTRRFGLNNGSFEAVQLELCQDLYLAEDGSFSQSVARPLQQALKHLIEALVLALN